MMIDWVHFTPATSLLGGAMIGLAAAALILFTGRIAGVSGILGGALLLPPSDTAWRLAFSGGARSRAVGGAPGAPALRE